MTGRPMGPITAGALQQRVKVGAGALWMMLMVLSAELTEAQGRRMGTAVALVLSQGMIGALWTMMIIMAL